MDNLATNMYHELDLKEFIKRNRKRILLSIFFFWLIFAILIITEDEIAKLVGNLKADPVDRLQYCIRWAIWTLLTPCIIFLALKFPIRKKYLFTDILKHFLLAITVIIVEFIVEIPIVRYAAEKITGTVAPVLDYATIFILKLNTYLLLYSIVVGATYLVLYMESINRSRVVAREAAIKNQQLETQLAEAKLNMLKMQLDPHFLFNTHHSIVGLLLNNENEKAIKMITKLSDLLRLSLEDQEQTILLERELELLKLYLEIQQIRFHDRLSISFIIEPAALFYKVPSFILQPLAENAIKYGVSLSSHAGSIIIGASISGNKLILMVENDGATIDLDNFREGIGIANTKARLHQLYNGQSNFELTNLPGESVAALITIPIN